MNESQNPQGHEPIESSAKGVLITGAALAILVGASLGGLWLWVRPMNPGGAPPVEAQPIARFVATQQAPLDPDQRVQRERYEVQQQEVLSTFGWIDHDKGVARIPIDDAMRRLVDERKAAQP